MNLPNTIEYGPTTQLSEEIDAIKYRADGETFNMKVARIAHALKDDENHRVNFKDAIKHQRFLPAGRVQNAAGSSRQTTAFNCFVSSTIEDDMTSIMEAAKEAAFTMRMGGGIGYNFSNIRPRGDLIKTLDSKASGPISFMGIFDAVCQCIASSGHRRGAQMGILNVNHPDIEEFITAKNDSTSLTGFNISIGVTDDFMVALRDGTKFPLTFEGRVYKYVDPVMLWEKVMRSTYDWAEPGVVFLDTMNKMNNLNYCERLDATNPCAEQPLPANGACLLGSFNLVKYVTDGAFNYGLFTHDITHVTRAMDNIVDRTIYPLKEQEIEAHNKRRMGLGVTGLANAAEMMGFPYASPSFMEFTKKVMETLRDYTYSTSSDLAVEKGSFPLYKAEEYLASPFVKSLSPWVQEKIKKQGMRNSHLTSIAPTGTISLTADNVSSGIEPPFALFYDRTIQNFTGATTERVNDYAYANGVAGRTANEISAQEHLAVLALASKFVDSAVSKTCNVGDDVTYEEFKKLYYDAWEAGCKGITTFRASGKRFGILNEAATDDPIEEPKAEACFIDPSTGQKSCE